MIDTPNRFKLYNFDNTWILTREKIASSWLVEHLEDWSELDINNYTYELKIPDFESSHTSLTEEEYYTFQNKFLSDWNLFIEGNPTDKNFIMLIRNPIQKFISGWVQDNIITKVYDQFIEKEHTRLLEYFNNDLVDEFINYAKDKAITHEFPDVQSLPIKFKDIYEEFCFPKNKDFFKKEFSHVIDRTLHGHPSQDLFIVWNLLFRKSLPNTNSLHIIDIDLEDLSYTLQNKFKIKLKKEDAYRNKRGKYLINQAYRYLSEDNAFINILFGIQIFFWFEIISKVYPKTLYETEKLPAQLKNLNIYKEKYFMDSSLDFFDIRNHINWVNHQPPEALITYTT